MRFEVTTLGGHVTARELNAVKALETAVSLMRAGSDVCIAEYTEGGSFYKSMTFYREA